MCGPHEKTQLAVLWTQGDRDTAETLVFKYVKDAKANGWWKHISLIIWGPSARLLAGDAGLQQKAKELLQAGVEVMADAGAAEAFGAAAKLQEIGVEVKDLGLELTNVLQDEYEEWAILQV